LQVVWSKCNDWNRVLIPGRCGKQKPRPKPGFFCLK
jgi:hypothetical protein